MSASPSVDDSFTFVGGLNTEGSFFLTPKNSWKEGDNVVPSTDGSISRRKAIDFEQNFQGNPSSVFTTPEDTALAYTVELWESVNGNGNLEFFVVQEGRYVSFYSAATGVVSASRLADTIDLSDFQGFGNTEVVGNAVISCASCYGKLIITSSDTDPILVSYDENATPAISARRIELKIRDFQGYRSPVAPFTEYTQSQWENINFYQEALYNLYNQGWTDDKIEAYKAANAGRLPSNTKQWIFGKDANDNFDANVLAKVDFGTSQAPRGRFIINAFQQRRGAAVNAVPGVSTGPTIVDFTPNNPNVNDGLITWTTP